MRPWARGAVLCGAASVENDVLFCSGAEGWDPVRTPRARTLVRFRAPSGARGWFVRGCFGGFYSIFQSEPHTPHFDVFSPHLGEVARAFLVRVTELCGAAFLAEESILFYASL